MQGWWSRKRAPLTRVEPAVLLRGDVVDGNPLLDYEFSHGHHVLLSAVNTAHCGRVHSGDGAALGFSTFRRDSSWRTSKNPRPTLVSGPSVEAANAALDSLTNALEINAGDLLDNPLYRQLVDDIRLAWKLGLSREDVWERIRACGEGDCSGHRKMLLYLVLTTDWTLRSRLSACCDARV